MILLTKRRPRCSLSCPCVNYIEIVCEVYDVNADAKTLRSGFPCSFMFVAKVACLAVGDILWAETHFLIA